MDGGVVTVAFGGVDVLHAVLENRGRFVEAEGGERIRLTRELFADLIYVVEVNVAVAASPHELTHAQTHLLSHHVGEECVGGDVEGDAEKHVRAALVELAGELSVRDVELKECVAGLERHLVKLGHVPGGDDDAPRIRGGAELVDDLGDLVDVGAIWGGPAAPLVAIDRAEFSGLVCPLIPDGDTVLVKPADVGGAVEEPQQFPFDGLHGHELCGDAREAFGEIVANLAAEYREGAGAGAVGFASAVF